MLVYIVNSKSFDTTDDKVSQTQTQSSDNTCEVESDTKTTETRNMAKQRKIHQNNDLPPSYEESIKAPHPGQQTVVRVVQVVMPDLGPSPATLTCPNCLNSITTSTSSSAGVMAWTLSAILCFTGFWPCFS